MCSDVLVGISAISFLFYKRRKTLPLNFGVMWLLIVGIGWDALSGYTFARVAQNWGMLLLHAFIIPIRQPLCRNGIPGI